MYYLRSLHRMRVTYVPPLKLRCDDIKLKLITADIPINKSVRAQNKRNLLTFGRSFHFQKACQHIFKSETKLKTLHSIEKHAESRYLCTRTICTYRISIYRT